MQQNYLLGAVIIVVLLFCFTPVAYWLYLFLLCLFINGISEIMRQKPEEKKSKDAK
jgi:Na+-transporting methylmalonyl-CoA/oxaloacetate decarboxylase gamma subunit